MLRLFNVDVTDGPATSRLQCEKCGASALFEIGNFTTHMLCKNTYPDRAMCAFPISVKFQLCDFYH